MHIRNPNSISGANFTQGNKFLPPTKQFRQPRVPPSVSTDQRSVYLADPGTSIKPPALFGSTLHTMPQTAGEDYY